MTCREAIDVLADFLDQTLSVEACQDLERHLDDCAPCRAYLSTYHKTRVLAGQAGRLEMPADLKVRLRRFLLDQLRSG